MIIEFEWLNQSGVQNVLNMVYKIVDIIRIIVPIVLIVMTTLDITKKVINPEEKDGQKKIMIRLIAAIVVFFSPVFIRGVFKVAGIEIDDTTTSNTTPTKPIVTSKPIATVKPSTTTRPIATSIPTQRPTPTTPPSTPVVTNETLPTKCCCNKNTNTGGGIYGKCRWQNANENCFPNEVQGNESNCRSCLLVQGEENSLYGCLKLSCPSVKLGETSTCTIVNGSLKGRISVDDSSIIQVVSSNATSITIKGLKEGRATIYLEVVNEIKTNGVTISYPIEIKSS